LDESMRGVLKVLAALLVFACIFALTWWVYFPHSPLGKQLANLKLAHAHAPIAEGKLRSLRGPEEVKVGAYTGLGGSLAVSGEVPDEQTAERVMAEVLATRPPVTVRFELSLGETNSMWKVVQPDGTATGSQPIR